MMKPRNITDYVKAAKYNSIAQLTVSPVNTL